MRDVEYTVFEAAQVSDKRQSAFGERMPFRIDGNGLRDFAFPATIPFGGIAPVLPSDAGSVYAERIRTLRDPLLAEAERRAGRVVLPVARMPVRLIPQVARAEDVAGSPWGIAATGADRSGDLQGEGVCVAILDTGIDATHPAFAGLVKGDNCRDFTGNGLQDNIGHGTHCAGIVFGRPVVGQRIAVAPGISNILIGKIADTGFGTTTRLLQDAMMWAVSEGAQIISLSIGLDFIGHMADLVSGGVPANVAQSQALNDYRDYTRQFDRLMGMVVSAGAAARSALVIAACGNDSSKEDGIRVEATLPAVAENVIAVGALGRNDDGSLSVAPFSNSGANVCGPGTAILSAKVGGGVTSKSGTSQAAPHVAGIAALWLQKMRREGADPTPADLRTALFAAAKRDAIKSEEDPKAIGYGLAKAPAA